MNKKIAVLIPCYNESLTIEKVIKEFKKSLPEADIYVYDNNSNDGTDEIAKNAGAIVRYEYRQGKGNVIRSMFREIEADCYIMADGDDTYPAEYAREMVDLIINKKADMVIGDRLSATYFTENKRPFHNIGNKSVRMIINKLFKSNVQDIMTGYRSFSRTFVKTFPVLSQGFEIETEMSIHALDKNFLLKDGIKVIKTIFNLYKEYKPLNFFGIIALILCLISIGLFLPIGMEYIATGLVPKFPTLIMCAAIFIFSNLVFASGVILDVVVKKNKQQFELFVNMIESNYNSKND